MLRPKQGTYLDPEQKINTGTFGSTTMILSRSVCAGRSWPPPEQSWWPLERPPARRPTTTTPSTSFRYRYRYQLWEICFIRIRIEGADPDPGGENRQSLPNTISAENFSWKKKKLLFYFNLRLYLKNTLKVSKSKHKVSYFSIQLSKNFFLSFFRPLRPIFTSRIRM